ncbi:protein kinase [bacterium]|nr:protein kinase [bacterium]
MALDKGFQLGPYRIVSLAGKGGMGEVYRARDERLGRDVALKVLPDSHATKPDAMKQFEREAKSLAALSHPNILSIFDIGNDQGIVYVVTEFLEGETLRSRLNTGQPPWKEVVAIASAVAEALAEAHSRGIVHRDLKPENIMITREGRVKILDFGLARLFERRAEPNEDLTTATIEGKIAGTIPYMSPEQIRGEELDSRTDLFSLGCVLYECLTGNRPFHGNTSQDVSASILKDEIKFPSASGGFLPPDLEAIVMRCLEKKRENRFQSAQDLAFALKSTAGASETARGYPATLAVSKPNLYLSFLIAVFVFASLGVLVWLFYQKPQSASVPQIKSLAVLPILNLSKNSEEEYLADGMTEQLIASLARFKALKVISRTSVMAYKSTKTPLPEIAKNLKVDVIVEGSVVRMGKKFQLTVQLIHAETDSHIWAGTYQRDFEDVLSVQNELAEAISSEIQIQLTPQEKRQLAVRRPVDSRAHVEYLKGRYYFAKLTGPDLQAAIQHFQRSLEIDPSYGAAYAGIADTYTMLSDYFLPPAECMPKAKATAKKALDLDPENAEAHTSLAAVHLLYEWDWQNAEKELIKALELNPNYSEAHRICAAFLASRGRSRESVLAIKKALELDPLSFLVNFDTGNVAFMLREFDLSIQCSKSALEILPSSQGPIVLTAMALAGKNEFKTAIDLVRRVDKEALLEESLLTASTLPSLEASLGMKKESEEYLSKIEEHSKHQFVCPYEIAVAHHMLGRDEEAIRFLESAYHHRSICMIWLRLDPRFDGLRNDSRFQDLMKRVGV